MHLFEAQIFSAKTEKDSEVIPRNQSFGHAGYIDVFHNLKIMVWAKRFRMVLFN